MKSSVEPLEGNKVKLSVEVDEGEFEKEIDAAFRRIAREVRIPGFRPGKAPRRILEARLGAGYAREEALREALPQYYEQAVKENEVDVIAPPQVEITAGEETGPVTFDAIVEVRPVVSVGGYEGLRITMTRPEATDDEVDAQIDRLRDQFAELRQVDRPAADRDHVSINIQGSRGGEQLPSMSADDFLYEVGSGTIASELDDNLRSAKVGDVIEFDAAAPDPDQEGVHFKVLVKDIKEKVLPDVDDEWANEVSEFDTVGELRTDLGDRITRVRRAQAQAQLQEKVAEALSDLVEDEAPEPLVNQEMQQRLQDLALRLSAQGIDLDQYLAITGTDKDQLSADLRERAAQSVKVDLALRALADAEDIEVTEADVDEELASVAARIGQPVDRVRREFERAEQVPAVRSDVRKRKALEWLVDHVEVVDEAGEPIDRADLQTHDEPEDDEPGETDELETADPAEQEPDEDEAQ